MLSISVHHRWYVHPWSIVVDVRRADGQASSLDMTRALFQIAEVLRERSFTDVRLACRRRHKFTLSGTDFAEIGRDASGGENPLYMVRTLPAKLRKPDGAEAFGSWTGGMIGVTTRQLEDSRDFHRQWWMEQLAK